MRSQRLVTVLGLCCAATWVSCNCGPRPGSDGTPCTQASDCASNVCTAGHCVGNGGSGGGTSSGGGTGGSAAGSGGPGGAGGMSLPDGGRCEGLACQVASCPAGGSTTLTGSVWDPAGNVPLYNAFVYVPNRPLAPFPAGPTCGTCAASITGSPVAIALTGPDGKFTLTGVPSGTDIPLVVQIGKWRRKVMIPSVTSCQTTALTDVNITRLPRDRSEGDLPQMAISSGNADAFECLLVKIGISDSEFTEASGGGRVHFYRQNGMDLATGAPAGNQLWNDAGTLMNYDVVMLPCEGMPNAKTTAAVRNVVGYADIGGRVFATHYSYVWTMPGWGQAADWRPRLTDLYNTTFDVTVDQTFPKGMAFAQWLLNVNASSTLGTLALIESRHDVVSVSPGSTRWLYGNIPASTPPESVQHLTYNTPFDAGRLADGGAAPQCGRVVFSDFHVTAGATDGGTIFPASCVRGPLTQQEKALEFMLFDLSACVQDDNSVPMVCKPEGGACMGDPDCCGGLFCRDAMSMPCTGASPCTCQNIIG